MGGFFGIAGRQDVISDVFFGTDYHSHLGTRRAGMAAYDRGIGLQREIHNIQNSPFRTKFAGITEEMKGTSAIGCISDYDPQPLLMRSKVGTYAICTIGIINNIKEIIEDYLDSTGGYFSAMTGGWINATEVTAALINSKSDYVEGIKYAQECIKGTCSILLLLDNGSIIAARDRLGRIPVIIGRSEEGYAASFEDFAFMKLGFDFEKSLGPGEIVEFDADNLKVLSPAREKKQICSFLWSYYGYPTATYEGKNVEMMRYENGRIMARYDKEAGNNKGVDYVAGVPDSGTPHAIGYANESGIPFARSFIKYTPTWSRSFTPVKQSDRNRVAKMKQIPVHGLIKGKNLLFLDDSIVRGTQLRETVEFLYENGARAVHMRSACPPIMYGCKFLNFSRSTSEMELIARRVIVELEGEKGFEHLEEYCDSSTERGVSMRENICRNLHLESLEFQSLNGVVEAIGLKPCDLCTYCWNGKECEE